MTTAKLRALDAPTQSPIEGGRTGLSKEALKQAFLDNLFCMQGKFPALATRRDYYLALAYVVRDRLLQRWISTAAAYTKQGSRTVAYLSAEFLMGPHLGNNLINLGIFEWVKQAIAELGLDIEDLLQQEEEPGLGNGGGSSNSTFSCPVRCRTCCASCKGRSCHSNVSMRNSPCS